MSLRGRIDGAVARALAPFPGVSRRWAERTATARAAGDVPWAPFTKPFADCRAAVVTTGGFHRPGDAPFDCDRGDPTFREIPGDQDLRALAISHTHYDTRDARRDPNILLPLDRLREIVREGSLGSVAAAHYSLMGYVPQVEELVGRTAPALAERLGRDEVDLVLLTPA